MATIKMNLAGMSIPEKIQFTRQVANAMDAATGIYTDGPYAPSDLDDLALTAEDAFNAAKAARTTAVTLTTLANTAAAALDLALTVDANYIENISNGDPVMIETAGYSVKASPTPIGDLPAPMNFTAEATSAEGEVSLRWTPVRGRKSYVVEQSTNVAGPWQSAAACTKARCTVQSLTSGTKYWFRVAAIGAAGQGAWSDPVARIVG